MTGPVIVVGFGVTGQAVARYLADRGEDVIVFDDNLTSDLAAAGRRLGVRIQPTDASQVAGASKVVPSPGVPPTHPVFAAATRFGVPIVSEIELAWEAAGSPMIAITGTNGKTTVTTWVDAILRASGIRSLAAGNIGLPLIEAVRSDTEMVVAEVSSFQLQYTTSFRPSVSCWLNLSPDHLDWHPDLTSYADAKSRVWINQAAGDTAIVNIDDSVVADRAKGIPADVSIVSYSTQRAADYTFSGGKLLGPSGEPFMDVQDLPRSLPHDISNSLAASATAVAAGATIQACRAALSEATDLPHRVSLVASAGGVSWYDDSKATTPASVLAAVAGFDSVVLIAGGRNKGLDLGVLAAAVPPVRAAVAIGESAAEVASALSAVAPVAIASSMRQAVEEAARLSCPGDAVLLSPGCASFDWYRSYGERGDDFAALVKEMLEEGGAKW